MKDNKALYAEIDSRAEGRYHELLQLLGERRSKNGNYHCWNHAGHSDGEDQNASLSLKNSTGQWKCHGCNKTGNFNTYFKEYVANSPNDKWGGSYSKAMSDMLDIKQYSDEDNEKLVQQTLEMTKHFEDMVKPKKTKPSTEPKKEIKLISQEQNDFYVESLLKMEKPRQLLFEKRFIKEDTIQKYRIGFSQKDGCITFPMIDAKGQIINIKMYRPWNPEFKWQTMVAGNPLIPTPVSHLTHSKLYIFEGEPDCYCAAAHGLFGITCGSASNNSFRKFYGDQLENIFRNKEIVFVMDADDKGITAATAMAKEMYGVAKQIKIIDLNKSDINPNGLDPALMKEVKGKQKRTEKDFTEFMQKNGMGEGALKSFLALEEATKVYTQNTRSKAEFYKVTLSESMNSRYYDRDSMKHLELVASIQALDEKIYKYPTQLCVSCRPLYDSTHKTGICKKCILTQFSGFGDKTSNEFAFNIIRMSDPASKNLGKFDIAIREEDLLALVKTTDDKIVKAKKELIGIPTRCSDVKFSSVGIRSIQIVNLVKDTEEQVEDDSNKAMRDSGNATNASVIAYFMGEKIATSHRIDVNKSYKIKAVQTLVKGEQSSVLFCYDIQPMKESFDHFQMDDEMYEMLSIFKPIGSIKDHLDERYRIFGNAAGINGRDELFFLGDLAYFSTIELKNEQVLPSVKRGWIEVLIAGDSRCGKSIVGEFLYNHYRVGGFVAASNAISRTGLVGGVVTSFGTKKVQWGKFPQNDRGIVIIDELSRLDHEGLESLTELRSSGYAQVEMVASGQIPARVRKICFSNWRGWRDEDIDHSAYGIENIRKLCYEDPILTRFDIAAVVKSGDVKKFDCKYEKLTSRFTSFQCRNLLYWAYSRRPDQIKFEDGISDSLNQGQEELLKTYHPITQMVNQEMRAKLCRMAISLATMTFSTDPEDWNVIFVKNEHVKYMVEFVYKLYSNKNMGMIEFSEEKRRAEYIGDMRFMMNILKYVDIESVLGFKEGNERDICQIFSDYLFKVTKYNLFIVDGKSDETKSSGLKSFEINDKFIGLLRARNCITKSFNKYRKTEVFTEWLKKRKEQGAAAETSDILELTSSEQTATSAYMPKDFIEHNKSNGTRPTTKQSILL